MARIANVVPKVRNYVLMVLFNIIILLMPQEALSNISFLSEENQPADTTLQEKAVKVFLDVSRRYHNYIKTEIPFVNYVRDTKQAQVHIMLTSERTGAGGREYTVTLIGQKNFENINDTLTYVSKQTDTFDMTRRGIVHVLKIGLMRYVSKTPLSDYISISYQMQADAAEVVDKWNYWVFNIDVDTEINGEESQKSLELDGSFSADRVTPEMKISLHARSSYEEDTYDINGTTLSSVSRSKRFRGLIVKSINQHWSAGGYVSAFSSTYRNTKFSADLTPAIEYNVFPYSEYTRREFRILYRAGYNHVKYEEETIYDKIQEDLLYESLSATYEFKERWGSLRSRLEGFHYFHDFSKNHLNLSGNINLRLFEGFSLNIFGRASMVHDQLSLPKGGATEEEILLERKEIATQYDYFLSLGLRYTFGSIYSNVVNPRFGNGGRRHY